MSTGKTLNYKILGIQKTCRRRNNRQSLLKIHIIEKKQSDATPCYEVASSSYDRDQGFLSALVCDTLHTVVHPYASITHRTID